MNTLEAGTAIAVAVAGWPLYQLVTSGDLDATTALVRGAVVAVGCVYGVTLVVRLAVRFEAQAQAERKRRLNEVYDAMAGAAADGTLTDPDVGKTRTSATRPGA